MAYKRIIEFKPGDYYFWAQTRSGENNVPESGFEVVVGGEKDTTTNFPLIPAIETIESIGNINVWYNTKTIIISDDFFERSFRIEYRASISGTLYNNNSVAGVGMRGGYKIDDEVHRTKEHFDRDCHFNLYPPGTSVSGIPETYTVKKNNETHTLWSLADFWGANYPDDNVWDTELIFDTDQVKDIVGEDNPSAYPNNCSAFYLPDNNGGFYVDGYQIFWEMDLPAQLAPKSPTNFKVSRSNNQDLYPTVSWTNPECQQNSMDLFTKITLTRKSNTGEIVTCVEEGALQESDVRDENGTIVIPSVSSYTETDGSNSLSNNSFYIYTLTLSNMSPKDDTFVENKTSVEYKYFTKPNPATSLAVTEYENIIILHANSDTVANDDEVIHQWQWSNNGEDWFDVPNGMVQSKNPSVTLSNQSLNGEYYRVNTTVGGITVSSTTTQKQRSNPKIWINVSYTY